jgi:SCP-2 sterol transfer family
VPDTQNRSTPSASDPISQFFTGLSQPGHLATFESESGTLRFEVKAGANVQRWHVTIHDGDVAVTRGANSADAVITAERRDFEKLVTGRLNGTAAVLRGLLDCQGSMAALVMFQRCLPGPPGSEGRVAPISSKTVMAQHHQESRRPA